MAESQTRNHVPKNVTLDPRVVDAVNRRRRETLEPFSTALCALVLIGEEAKEDAKDEEVKSNYDIWSNRWNAMCRMINANLLDGFEYQALVAIIRTRMEGKGSESRWDGTELALVAKVDEWAAAQVQG